MARAGEMAMMQCEYINQEPVEWDKDGTSVISGDSPCDCTISRDGHLLFNNVSAEDVGDYTCVVTIMFNPHRCSATLRLAGEMASSYIHISSLLVYTCYTECPVVQCWAQTTTSILLC